MADSDDDYDRRKRDKFRRERNDYDRRDENRRDSWEDRRGMRGNYNRQSVRSREILYNSRNNRDRREMYAREQQYDNRRRDRFSPTRHDMGQPAKRMRRDWDENYGHFDIPYGGGGRGGGPGGMQMGGGGGGRPHWGHGAAPDMGGMAPHPDFTVTVGGPRLDVDYPTQPPMLSFKAFLSQQDDTIGEEEAIKRYNDYKLDFKKQQISEFFVAHKEEEWFKSKYHPEEFAKRQAEIRVALQSRLAVFSWLREMGRLDNLQIDVEKSEEILKILDAAVIKLEGGTDLDLTILEEPEKEETSRSRTTSENVPADKIPETEKKEETKVEEENKTEKTEEAEKKETTEENDGTKVLDKPLEMAITPEQEELQKKAKEYQIQQEEQKKKGKRKKNGREKSDYSYGSESESDNGSISDAEPAPPGLEDEPPPPGMEEGEANGAEKGQADDKSSPSKEGKKKEGEGDEDKDINTKPEEEEEPAPPKPRPLHRTNSIFLRNLAPTITKQEVEALCKRYPGFMRVALQDPLPERRFFRRGWATFAKNVNIKDICWNLNNIRLRDCELGATLNRELKQRVRPVNGLTVHRTVARNDIKLAARIIQSQDKKWNLWTDPEEEKKDQDKDIVFNFTSKNPVLHNITDYLVEEGSFEEEELLGTSQDEKKDGSHEVIIDREDSMLKVLDRMVLYLRLVHSIDYYNASEYPNEDEMPHRCGIMHARGMPPGSTAKITQNDVTEYMTNFENKLKTILETATPLTDEEAHRLGKKNPDTEVEKFVQANTQELAKDKWLCPLSGKKFKGPDFVRKHIFNKHAEKVEEVKKEVTFFNTYLMDTKRPGLPEHPGNRPPPPPPPREPPPQQQPQPQHMAGGPGQVPPSMMGFGGGRQPPPMFGGNMPSFGGPMYGHQDMRDFGRARGGGRGYGGRRSDPRPIIEYRDLDAPDEMDIF